MQYVIFFTPRSGSSWLTDIASQVDFLGIPAEYFNPNFLPQTFKATGSSNLEEFRVNIAGRRTRNGVFGVQVTYHQIKATFGEQRFSECFPEKKCIWLIREDIVAQAISLVKLRRAKVAHSLNTGRGTVLQADRSIEYDAAAILHSIEHIRYAERMTEAMLARHGYDPLRISYERNMEAGPKEVLEAIGSHLCVDVPETIQVEQHHRKIGTKLNNEFSDRFKSASAEFLERVRLDRSEMIKALDKY